MNRRAFLHSSLLAFLLTPARAGIGEICFCRVADTGWLRLVPRGCVFEVDPATDGITLLGSRATLVITRSGWSSYEAGA